MERKSTKKETPLSLGDFIVEKIVFISGITSIIIVIAIFFFLFKESYPTFRGYNIIKDVILGKYWYPLSERFGILPLILGSIWVTLGAIIIAVPLGISCAIFISKVAPPLLREILKPTLELLASIPSVLLGFIGIVILSPWIREIFDLNTGLTGLTGSIMLAFMSLPIIVSISEDAITAVPQTYIEGSLALGASWWETIIKVIVPSAMPGIIAAVMLGLGRAIGETMTVMMVTGNAAVIPKTILQPMRTMTATIAAEMGETVQYSDHFHALFTIGVVLFIMTAIINLIADFVLHKYGTRGKE